MASRAQEADSGLRGALFDSVKVPAGALLAIAHTRLELLSTEIEEQRAWLGSMVVWMLVALFCAWRDGCGWPESFGEDNRFNHLAPCPRR